MYCLKNVKDLDAGIFSHLVHFVWGFSAGRCSWHDESHHSAKTFQGIIKPTST